MTDFYALCLAFLLLIVFGAALALTVEMIENYCDNREDD